VDSRALIQWLENRLVEYRARALSSDNARFHLDTRASELVAILEAIQSDDFCIDKAEIENA